MSLDCTQVIAPLFPAGPENTNLAIEPPAPGPRPLRLMRRALATFVRRILLITFGTAIACGYGRCPNDPLQDNAIQVDPTLDASPNPVTVPQGGSAIVALRAASTTGVSSAGPTAGLHPDISNQTIVSGTSANVTINADGTTSLGRHDNVRLTESFTYFRHNVTNVSYATVNVDVVEAFTMATTPAVTGRAGQTVRGQVSITRTPGFTAPMTLSLTGLPTGSTPVFGTVPPDATSSVPYTFTAPADTPPRVYMAQLTATGNAVTRSVPVTFTIDAPLPTPELSLQLSATALSMQSSATATVDITINKNAGVTDDVALSASELPDGVTATFAPAAVSGRASQLTLTSTSARAVTNRTVTISATANGVTRTAALTLTVLPPDFTITALPAAVSLQGTVTQPVISELMIGRTGLPDPVSLTATGVPSGVMVSITPASTTLNAALVKFTADGTAIPGLYPITITGTGAGLVRSATIALTVLPLPGNLTAGFRPSAYTIAQGETVTLTLDLLRTGSLVGVPLVIATVAAPPFALVTLPSAPVTGGLTFVTLVVGSLTPPNNYPLTISATGGTLVRQATATITVIPPRAPDFTLSAFPSTWTLPRGEFTPFSIIVNKVGGFNAPITFSALNPLPGNMIIEYVTNPTSAEFATVRVYASPNVAPGSYTVAFTGTSGALSHVLNVTVVVQP